INAVGLEKTGRKEDPDQNLIAHDERERGKTPASPNAHTPGPWNFDEVYVVAPDPKEVHPDIYIAEIAYEDAEGRVVSRTEQEANLKLIAAAPELLASLEVILVYAEHENASLYECWKLERSEDSKRAMDE